MTISSANSRMPAPGRSSIATRMENCELVRPAGARWRSYERVNARAAWRAAKQLQKSFLVAMAGSCACIHTHVKPLSGLIALVGADSSAKGARAAVPRWPLPRPSPMNRLLQKALHLLEADQRVGAVGFFEGLSLFRGQNQVDRCNGIVQMMRLRPTDDRGGHARTNP